MKADRGRTPTLHDVARRAGVSVSTASRALSDRPHVSIARRQSVVDAAAALGYRPNVTARSLRTSRSMTVGFVAHSLLSPGLIRVLNGLTEALEEADYTLLVTNAHDSQESYRRLLPRLFDRRVDALFLANPDLAGNELSLYREAGIPTLALVSRGPGCDDIPLVNVSSESASAEAAARIAALGHRRAALMLSAISLRTDFAATLRRSLERNGIGPTVFEVEDGDVGTSVEQVLAALKHEGGPTLAFATAEHALALLGACNRAGVRIPDDLSICAITDHESLTLPSTPVAALASDTDEPGRRAAEIMFGWLDGADPPNVTSLDISHWVERESIGWAPRP